MAVFSDHIYNGGYLEINPGVLSHKRTLIDGTKVIPEFRIFGELMENIGVILVFCGYSVSYEILIKDVGV